MKKEFVKYVIQKDNYLFFYLIDSTYRNELLNDIINHLDIVKNSKSLLHEKFKAIVQIL